MRWLALRTMLSITKLQNLKAIHNHEEVGELIKADVINHKTTKFESNSQLNNSEWYRYQWCYQSQNYKIWKQFTTTCYLSISCPWLLSITKLQNLKAIHNRPPIRTPISTDVINHKTTKFESNSQLRIR